MTKAVILAEIRRIAVKKGGKPPGREVFERETGIKQSEWYPALWLRWGEALSEAGYGPNSLQGRMEDASIIRKYAEFVRELGKLPVAGELRIRASADPSFPSHTIFGRFGGRQALLACVAAFCSENPDFADVASIVNPAIKIAQDSSERSSPARVRTGFVYLMKSGRHYKIGRTNSLGRREFELGIKIPIPPTTLHAIETDDPVGVEAYWHRRFADKRGEGEWFSLSREDIEAFKRWKKLV
ncbi:MAG: GIY-YIG nuclease family protein [Lysobacterales bacterium]